MELLCEFIKVWPHCYDHQGRDPLFLIQYVHWINVWEWTGSTDVSSISKQNNLQNVEKLTWNGLVWFIFYICSLFSSSSNFRSSKFPSSSICRSNDDWKDWMISFEITFHCTAKEIGAKAAFLFEVTHLIKTLWNVGKIIW